MKHLRQISISIIIAFAFMTSAVFAAEKTDPEAAKEHVRFVAEQAIAMLKDQESTNEEIALNLRDLLEKNMAANMIGRIVLGKPWRKMNDSQKEEYQGLFKEYLFTKYASLISSYNGQTIKVMNAVPAGKHDVMVFTNFISEGSEPTKVGWRIRSIKGQMKLLDVKIADLSMVQTERDQFQNVYKNSDIDGLLVALKKLITKMRNKTQEQVQKS